MSGAYVELYSGNDLLYTIHVPENHVGTVWHVFDIDGETGQVTLVNEFSNENNPGNVGNSLAIASFGETTIPMKDYEIQEQQEKQRPEATEEQNADTEMQATPMDDVDDTANTDDATETETAE